VQRTTHTSCRSRTCWTLCLPPPADLLCLQQLRTPTRCPHLTRGHHRCAPGASSSSSQTRSALKGRWLRRHPRLRRVLGQLPTQGTAVTRASLRTWCRCRWIPPPPQCCMLSRAIMLCTETGELLVGTGRQILVLTLVPRQSAWKVFPHDIGGELLATTCADELSAFMQRFRGPTATPIAHAVSGQRTLYRSL
jgi:hypothetical protein